MRRLGLVELNGEAESEVPGNRTLTAKNNRIMFNKLGDSHTKLPGDGGTLYTLGYQPNSIIAYNYIYDGLVPFIWMKERKALWSMIM